MGRVAAMRATQPDCAPRRRPGAPRGPWDSRALEARSCTMGGLNAAVVGLLAAAFYDPVWTSAIHTRWDVALALAAFGLLVHARLSPVLVVACAALAGALTGQLVPAG